MRQFMITVTALAAFGAVVATAQADVLHGAPQRNGSRCFTYSDGNTRDSRFGYWRACPQGAAVTRASRSVPARPAAPPHLLPPPGPDRQLEARDGMR